jgi:hypothetical protein
MMAMTMITTDSTSGWGMVSFPERRSLKAIKTPSEDGFGRTGFWRHRCADDDVAY